MIYIYIYIGCFMWCLTKIGLLSLFMFGSFDWILLISGSILDDVSLDLLLNNIDWNLQINFKQQYFKNIINYHLF